jgi:hypothetical protein
MISQYYKQTSAEAAKIQKEQDKLYWRGKLIDLRTEIKLYAPVTLLELRNWTARMEEIEVFLKECE